jgi:purine-binding chemotaxis protein CheW
MSDPSGPALPPLDVAWEPDEAPEELRRLILFQACDEWFALPIAWVREIQPLEGVTRVPNAPAEILGIMNLRGRILTLFNLATALGIPSGTRPATHAVVLDLSDPDLHIGLAAQRIAQVREVPVLTVEAASRDGVGALEGILGVEGQAVGLLDPARVFARYLSEWGVTLETRAVD